MVHTADRGQRTSPRYAATPLATRLLMGVVSASISSTILGGILLPFEGRRAGTAATPTTEPIVALEGRLAACAAPRPM